MKPLRCAIYTRKSSEEGLGQDFNSLHAQREACEAYIKSQAGEGWRVVKTPFDDGGYSGGGMDRPALKALLAEIEAGGIDVVVVYKVDRLTRSLMDFAKIIETFDRKGVSFVSVTQSFNTTSSMGRLTLNVLLSFAQFEREVTGERIRDKVAASKAKGMWMGGNPALGYDIRDRKLLVNAAEADRVRHLFSRYLALGTVRALKIELDREGVTSKLWTSRAGRTIGGQAFSRGALFKILSNRLYLGEVVHKGMSHPGQHEPIVEAELFEAVQEQLRRNAVTRAERSVRPGVATLKGLIFDVDGRPMSPAKATGKSGKAFRYYVSTSLQQGERRAPGDDAVRRISAPQIEALVDERLRRLGLSDASEVLRRVEIRAESVELRLQAQPLIARYGSAERAVAELDRQFDAHDRLSLSADGLIQLAIGVRPVFRGGRTWLVNPGGAHATAKAAVDRKLLQGLKRAHRLAAEHAVSPLMTTGELKRGHSPADSYARRLAQLAFLSPTIQQAIVQGRQPPGLTLQRLLDGPIPDVWADQHKLFGFPVIRG